MPMFAALDVSKKETQVHFVDISGSCVWRGKVPTNPKDIAMVLQPYAKQLEKVGLETGSWSSWLFHGLTDLGFNVACMDARQAHAALLVTVNKTDANNAEGLAHLLRTGLFREVRVKPWCDLRRRALLRARATLVRTVIDLGNAIRSALRLFGLTWPLALVRVGRGPLSAVSNHTSPSHLGWCPSSCRYWKPGAQRENRWLSTKVRSVPKIV